MRPIRGSNPCKLILKRIPTQALTLNCLDCPNHSNLFEFILNTHSQRVHKIDSEH